MTGLILITVAVALLLAFLWRKLPIASLATARVRLDSHGRPAVDVRGRLNGPDLIRFRQFLEEIPWERPCTVRVVRGARGPAVRFRGPVTAATQQRIRNFVVNCLRIKNGTAAL